MRALVLTVACLLVAAHAHTQTVVDPRWTPFLGCWDLVVQDAPPTRRDPDRREDVERSPNVRERHSAQVCVEPDGAGVTMSTTVADHPALMQTLIADASARPIVDDTCRGTERAEWSRDGQRLFSRATLACPGEPERSVSGITLMSGDGQWIDVQSVSVASRENVRVRRYRRSAEHTAKQAVGSGSTATSRMPVQQAGSGLSIEDVIEASHEISAGALEAALIESHARFGLSGRTLLTLDDAGVPDSVTDLMVALSYPSKFVVTRTSRDDRLASVDPYGYVGPWASSDYLVGALDAAPYAAPYGFYFYSGYYYSPFGYAYLRAYPVFIGDGGFGTSTGSVEAVPREQGRVIDGLGYTRVLPTRDAEPLTANDGSRSTRGTSDRGAVTPTGYTDSGANSNGSGGATNTGGSSTSSSSGSAGSSGDSGRTAVPR